jgi:Flp pilus assembly protein TadD
MGTGRLDEAQKSIEEWTAKKPNEIRLPNKKALLLALKGDFRAAEDQIPAILRQTSCQRPSLSSRHLRYRSDLCVGR